MDRDKKMQEPEDNMRYAEKKAVRMMNNGLNDKDDSNLLKKEKKDFELLKTKESKSDTFGPLTNKETERLQNLSIKREKDKDANYWFNITFCSKLCWGFDIEQRCILNGSWWSSYITEFWTWYKRWV